MLISSKRVCHPRLVRRLCGGLDTTLLLCKYNITLLGEKVKIKLIYLKSMGKTGGKGRDGGRIRETTPKGSNVYRYQH